MVLLPNGAVKLEGASEEPLKLGEPALDFTRRDQSGRKISLSDYDGRPVVLFVAGSVNNTIVTDQLQRLEAIAPQLRGAGAEVLVFSSNYYQQNKTFADQNGINNLILLDDEVDQEAIFTYQQPIPEGFANPLYVLDANHVIADMEFNDERLLSDEHISTVLDVLTRPPASSPVPAPTPPAPPPAA